MGLFNVCNSKHIFVQIFTPGFEFKTFANTISKSKSKHKYFFLKTRPVFSRVFLYIRGWFCFATGGA